MNVNHVKLLVSAVSKKQYPAEKLPEIAFVGRSNVGKSSLINKLINRKSFARVSGVPGKTATINFYSIEEQLIFVDLPGYGYAKRSRAEIEKWGSMIEEYLLSRETLELVVLLVDIRHKPTKDDCMMLDWLAQYNMPTLIIATKRDKLKNYQIEPALEQIMEVLNIENRPIPFSSETGVGKDEVWEIFDSFLEDE